MLTTQVQVLLYVGNIQIVSCSVFIPVPAIVVKSHQTLEAILPYLPLSLTSASAPTAAIEQPQPLAAIDAPPISDTSDSASLLPSSNSLILSPSSSAVVTTVTSSTTTPTTNSNTADNNNHTKGHHHRHSSSSAHSNAHSSALTISPDSSIPATTCIKISLQPTPTFKLVTPKCPHQQQRNRNLRHLKQQQLQKEQQEREQQQQLLLLQQQEQQLQEQRHRRSRSPPLSSPQASSRSHSRSHSRSRSPSSSSSSTSNQHRSHRRHSHIRRYTSMTSLEQPPSPTVGNNNNDSRPSILFTYPFPTNKDTPLPKTVQITGTFNNWGRTDPLVPNKDQSRFELSIAIETEENQQQQKILFKYVINDEDWVTDASQARERDQAGNMNNILFLDSRNATTSSTQNSTKSEETTMATQDVISTKGTKQEPTESEEDRIARLKQEEEDDATIRQLGGGMWGAPMFSVNDPVNLPEHFVDSAAPASTTADQEHEVEEKEERAQQSQNVDPSIPAIVVATAGNTQQQQKLSTETVAADRHEEEKSTVIAPTSSATAAVTPTTQEAVQEQEEDEDDKTIRMLGGGMWGTPFFKVNDPASLPEHFVEAIGATTIAEPSELEQLEVVADREEELSEGEVVRDDVSVTMEGTLIETVVETTEDTVIEDAAGNFLEETITTSVQDSVEGSVSEEVTEVVETIEDIEPADPVSVSAPASQETAVKTPLIVEENSSSEPQMTITETEVTSVGADGVETTVLEETITFVEGPEVDSSSLHSLTTGIKPIQENESVLIETLPEYNVETPPSTAGASSSSAAISAAIPVSSPLPTPSLVVAGDAKPSMDLSTATATEASTLTPISTARTSLHGDHYDGDNGAVYLHDQPVGPTPSAGDARPETDLSVQVTPATTEKKPIVVSPTTAQKPSATAKPTEKSEKRRSFWKKLKKVLS